MSDPQTEQPVLTVADIASKLKSDGDKTLVLLVGIPASGKTNLARRLAACAEFTHLNSDSIREELTGDENDHQAEDVVWATFLARFKAALELGGSIIIDNMNHTRHGRDRLAEVAQSFGYQVKLVFLEVPLSVCIARNKRRDKTVSDFVIMEKFMQFKRMGKPLPDDWALWLAPTQSEGEYLISQRPQYNVEVKLDIIGDVHGCLTELKQLLKLLGYELHASGRFSKPYDRNVLFVGDLTERGPASAGVLEYAMKLHAHGVLFVLGNHCYKLLRALQGEQVKLDADVQQTLDQIHARGDEFTQAVIKFLSQTPTIYETRDLIVVHAAYKELARGEKAESLALYGETTGERDKSGYPIRLDKWETAYLGGKTIVHGHVPLRNPTLRNVYNGGRIVNVDTACCFGGKLTALRYPEMEFISVPALATYSAYMPGDVEQHGVAKMLDYADKNPIWTGSFGIGKGLPTLARFAEMERDGWIWSKSLKTRDGLTYRLFNYGKSTTYERVWNDVTLASRGLIVCEETGECIAAVMPKFFNLGETITLGKVANIKEGPFQAFVKLDGACGTGYRLDGELRFATRGAFGSPQAQAAERIWRDKYAQHSHLFFNEWLHLTPIVEVIDPTTTQVVRYDFKDLVLIACRDRFTGATLPYEELVAISARIGMPVVEKIDSSDPETLLHRVSELGGNEEGFVWLWPCGYRLKTKGEQYKLKHRMLAGITPSVLAFAWWDGSIVNLLPMLEEEYREDTEALCTQLDANTIELLKQVEELYVNGAQYQDQKSFAAWVKTQPPQLAGMIFGRRQLDYPKSAAQLSRAALAELLGLGHLHKLVEEAGDDELCIEIARYEQVMSQFLWDNTRSQELRGKVLALGKTLPKSLRGDYVQVLENLDPQRMIDRARDFVRTSAVAQISCIDIDAVFASAPPASAAEQIHNSWVFGQDMRLRPFLDRWRSCGRRETADLGARKLLSEAVRSGVVQDGMSIFARVVRAQGTEASFDPAVLAKGLDELAAQVLSIWNGLPREAGPQAMADAVGTLGPLVDYGRALLHQAWSSQRTQVRDAYLEADPQMESFSRLDEA